MLLRSEVLRRERLFAGNRSGRTRPDRVETDEEDEEMPSSAPSSPSSAASARPLSPTVDASGFTPNLRELVDLLNTPAGLKMFKAAYRDNMRYKVEKYGELARRAERAVADAQDVVDLKMPELKRAAGLKADDDAHNWDIFNTVASGYLEAKDRASQFEAIRQRALERLGDNIDHEDVQAKDAIKGLRDDLVRALQFLTNFSTQAHIVNKTTDIVAAFIKNPKLFRTKLMNFMMMGIY